MDSEVRLAGFEPAIRGFSSPRQKSAPTRTRLGLAHEDGSYEWVPTHDYRVREVRLLHDAATVGEIAPDADRPTDNLLVRGEALNALTALRELPEFARVYERKVKLVYIDPPFNTQQAFSHYDDALEHSVWLTMMRDRLQLVKKLLMNDGSVWVHCDDSEQAYLKIMMHAWPYLLETTHAIYPENGGSM
jgi:adenine-specific DNA-methyltransferase